MNINNLYHLQVPVYCIKESEINLLPENNHSVVFQFFLLFF